MLSKRILWTLLITAMIIISTTVTQAQSIDRKLWPMGGSVSHPAPEQAAEPAAETQTALQSFERCDFLCIIERQKTAIVGVWLGTLDDGTKILTTFNADGTLLNSVQGGISTDPARPTHTAHHGVWRHLGGRQFGLTIWDIIYDLNTGQLQLYTKIRAVLTLGENGDEVSGSAKLEFLNPQGDVVASFPSDLSYKRIKFEPLN